MNNERWLEVEAESQAASITISSCVALGDLYDDGDFKLVLADIAGPQSLLKVLKGTTILAETTLPELPSGLVIVYNETRMPRCPLVAVSSGSSIYLYRNLRPYYKFSLPPLEINSLEMDLWIQARDSSIDSKRLYEMLAGLQQDIGFAMLSQESQKLLTFSCHGDPDQLNTFVSQAATQPLTRRTVITCSATLNKNSSNEDAVCCIVLGSEDCAISFVDVEAFTLIDKIEQMEDHGDRTVPAILQTSGLLDVEFRVVVCNRNGKVTLLRRGWKQSKVLMQLSVQPVDMIVLDNGLIIILTSNLIECFSKKGRRQWEQTITGPALGLAKMQLPHLGMCLVGVAVEGGAVLLYNGRHHVDTIRAPATVTAITFGKFGQEDYCCILVTSGGTIVIKLLKRTAQFTPLDVTSAAVVVQKLNIPKRSKLIVEQVARERENAIEMHEGFQRELFQLRLQAARDLAAMTQQSTGIISHNDNLPINMTAQIFGLGPAFKIKITLENMAAILDHKLPDLDICIHYNHSVFTVNPVVIKVPYLVPGLTYELEAMVRAVQGEILLPEQMLILLVTPTSSKPLLSTTLTIPVCDLLPINL